MKKNNLFYILILIFSLAACAGKKSSSSASNSSTTPEAKISEIEKSDKIVWLDYDEAAELAKVKPKKIFVDVYTNWCGWCKRMDATTMQDGNIINYLNKNYYSVKLNAESSKKLTYRGQEMTEAELARNIFQATGYPTTVYLAEDQKVIQPIPGYMDVDMLSKILRFYGEDHYKTMTWDRFRMSYNAE